MKKFPQSIDILSRILNYVAGFSFKKNMYKIGGNMKEKTKQLLAYLIQNHPPLPVTSLMKLSYIVDHIVSIKKYDKPISGFEYVRYKYGPFDNKIYKYIENLSGNKIVSGEPAYTPMGDEYIIFKYNDDVDISFDKLTRKDREVIDEVLDSLRGYGAKALVDLSYKTKPMEKIGARQDNEAGLNDKLDLRAE